MANITLHDNGAGIQHCQMCAIDVGDQAKLYAQCVLAAVASILICVHVQSPMIGSSGCNLPRNEAFDNTYMT